VTRVVKLAIALALSCAAFARTSAAQEAPQPPRYEMTLALDELTAFHAVAEHGVRKYGVPAPFEIELRAASAGLEWRVAIEGRERFLAWDYWAKEKTVEIFGGLDLEHLDAGAKSAARAFAALARKLEEAKAHPRFEPFTVTALVRERGAELWLESDAGAFVAAGERAAELRDFVGRTVLATGLPTEPGKLVLQKAVPRRDGTLETFVMSHCPFGKRAQRSLLEHSAATAGDVVAAAPRVEFRYLFYRSESGGRVAWTSMHGESELAENLVQMILRDEFPGYYASYVLARITAGDQADWRDVARGAAVDAETIAAVDEIARTERDVRIEREWRYAVEQYAIRDGSPTFVWESRVVRSLRSVRAFEGVETSSESCATK
jgi:hypothetical protein